MAKRSEKRDAAKAAYIAGRTAGKKVSLRELAQEMEVSYQTLRNWKAAEKWDDQLPKRKRGGQPGNKNSKGKKNAAGTHPGAPEGNRNAEKDGAYSRVFLESLEQDERDVIEKMPLEGKAALEHEMKILKYRENRILLKIREYEEEPEGTLYVSSVLDMRVPKGGADGAEQQMGMYTKDSGFARVLKLQEALYKVQGRIAAVAASLRAIEEHAERMELEREKLEILRTRATGAVDLSPPEEEGAEGG